MKLSSGRAASVVVPAILLVGCTVPGIGQQPDVPSGVHLLADAIMSIVRLDQGQLEVKFSAHNVNAGTETCTEAESAVDWWPPELRDRIIRETTWGWRRGGTPVHPGQREAPEGETLFDVTGMSEDQVLQLLEDLTVTIRCNSPDGYMNRVLLTLKDERQ